MMKVGTWIGVGLLSCDCLEPFVADIFIINGGRGISDGGLADSRGVEQDLQINYVLDSIRGF